MNLLNDDIETIAERVKLRAMAAGPVEVMIEDSGKVHLRGADKWQRKAIPDRCRVGIYTRAAQCDEIEDDLIVRLREIARGR